MGERVPAHCVALCLVNSAVSPTCPEWFLESKTSENVAFAEINHLSCSYTQELYHKDRQDQKKVDSTSS